MATFQKKHLKTAIGLAVVATLAIFIVRHKDQFVVVERVSFPLFAVLVVINGAMLCVIGLQMLEVGRHFGLSCSARRWWVLYFVSRFLNRVFPQIGTAYLLTEVKRKGEGTVSGIVGLFATSSAINRMITVFYTAVATAIFSPTLLLLGFSAWAVLLVSLVAVVAVIPFLIFLHRVSLPLFRRFSWLERLHQLSEAILRSLLNVRLLCSLSITSFVGFVLSIVSNAVAFNALAEPVGVGELAVVRLLKSLLDLAMITPGNAGLSEGLYATLSSLMGTTPAAAIIVSALNTVASVVSVFFLAVITGGGEVFAAIRSSNMPEVEGIPD